MGGMRINTPKSETLVSERVREVPSADGVQGYCSQVREKWNVRLTDGSGCSDVDTIPVHCGNEIFEPEGKGPN